MAWPYDNKGGPAKPVFTGSPNPQVSPINVINQTLIGRILESLGGSASPSKPEEKPEGGDAPIGPPASESGSIPPAGAEGGGGGMDGGEIQPDDGGFQGGTMDLQLSVGDQSGNMGEYGTPGSPGFVGDLSGGRTAPAGSIFGGLGAGPSSTGSSKTSGAKPGATGIFTGENAKKLGLGILGSWGGGGQSAGGPSSQGGFAGPPVNLDPGNQGNAMVIKDIVKTAMKVYQMAGGGGGMGGGGG